MKRIKSCAFALLAAISIIISSPSPAAAKRILFNTTNESGIWSIDPDGSNLHSRFATGTPISTSLAYEPLSQQLYFGIDSPTNYIIRSDLPGNLPHIIFVGDGPDSLAIDSNAGKIYFGSEDSGTLQRVNLDGTGNETLFTDVGQYPLGIAVDAAAGKVYWTSTGSNRYIHRANLDGTAHEELLTGPGPGLTFGQPFGIALDVADGKMYFSDEDDSRFYRANLDGTNVEPFIPAGNLHPHGIVLDLDTRQLYWAQEGAIGVSDLDGSNAVLYSVLGFPNNLVMVPEPASWLLAGVGLAALIVVRRRSR